VVGLARLRHGYLRGDLVIVDGNHAWSSSIPTRRPANATRKRAPAIWSLKAGLANSATCRRDPRQGARLVARQHRVPQRRPTASRAAATASACTAPSSFTSATRPTQAEADHLEAYATVLRLPGSQTVVIRTLDLGADQFATSTQTTRTSAIPSLVSGACALCLRQFDLFQRKCVPF